MIRADRPKARTIDPVQAVVPPRTSNKTQDTPTPGMTNSLPRGNTGKRLGHQASPPTASEYR